MRTFIDYGLSVALTLAIVAIFLVAGMAMRDNGDGRTFTNETPPIPVMRGRG